MKVFLLVISLFSLPNIYGQKVIEAQKSITIFSCETGLIYHYKDNKVIIKGTWFVPNETTKIWFSKTVDNATSRSFNKLFDSFLKLDSKLFYYNHCVLDGFNFKVYIQNGNSVQKIFVGNYYDKLVDSLTALFQEQLEDFKPGFSVDISYGKNKEYIDGLIKSQTECKEKITDDYKNHLLNNWCEIEEKY